MAVKTFGLPEGLPARFTESKHGLSNLQDLLGLSNRKDWQPILHADRVKSIVRRIKPQLRSLKTSQRIARSVTFFYGVPKLRRELWELHLIGGELDATADSKFESFATPSIEYKALNRYHADFRVLEARPEEIEESLRGISNRRTVNLRHYPDWQIPGLSVWPELRRDLVRWHTLSADRQVSVALATFAVATIMDDVRFLVWAAGRSKQLAHEFAFALTPSDLDVTNQAGSNHDEPPIPSDYEQVLHEWNRTCDLIVDIASELGAETPQPERLDNLLEPVKRLQALEEHILPALEARNRAILIGDIVALIAGCAKEFDAPWLAGIQNNVRAQWELAYRLPSDITELVVKEDVQRLEVSLRGELRRWREAENTKEPLRTELGILDLSGNISLESQLKAENREERLHKRMAESARQANEAKRRVLRALGPGGMTFQPSRDYERELAEAKRSEPVAMARFPRNGGDRGSRRETKQVQDDSDGDREVHAESHIADRDPPNASNSLREHSESSVPESGLSLQKEGRSSSGSVAGVRAKQHSQSNARQDGSERSRKTLAVDSIGIASEPSDLYVQSSKASARASDSSPSESIRKPVPEDFAQASPWERWLKRIGNPADNRPITAWKSSKVPRCMASSPIPNWKSFGRSLADKLACGQVDSPSETLRTLAQYFFSDPVVGPPQWEAIYKAILDHCVLGDLDKDDSQNIAFLTILQTLGTNPSVAEYQHLIDVGDELTELTPSRQNVMWSLDLAEAFLCNRIPDATYLVGFLDKIHVYVSSANYHLSAKRQRIANDIQKNVTKFKEGIPGACVHFKEELSSFLKGKRMVIYTLQRSTAVTIRKWLEAISPGIDITLLSNKVWSDNLKSPVRNADICIMVTSAATHAVTEMISRIRRDVGKDLIVPASKGVYSLQREIYRAAGIDESALEYQALASQVVA